MKQTETEYKKETFMTQTLDQIQKDERVIISGLSDQLEDPQELQTLGFTPGTPATLLSKAPFSGPITIQVRGSKLAIRKKDAACILVRS